MSELIHKLLYTTIGFAALTEEKAKELVAELENKGEVSCEEGKKLAQELIEKTRHHSQELRKTIGEEFDKLIGKIKLVSRDDFEQLKRRLDELEKKGQAPDHDDSL